MQKRKILALVSQQKKTISSNARLNVATLKPWHLSRRNSSHSILKSREISNGKLALRLRTLWRRARNLKIQIQHSRCWAGTCLNLRLSQRSQAQRSLMKNRMRSHRLIVLLASRVRPLLTSSRVGSRRTIASWVCYLFSSTIEVWEDWLHLSDSETEHI